MRPIYRLPPKLPPQAMKTYQIARPLPTHWRVATCAEVDCGAWQHGWKTVLDVAKKIGQTRANYIRLHSGRAFTVEQVGTLVTFTFSAGQRCFTQHLVPVGREPLFAVREGDWRGNPRGTEPVRFTSARQFVDDFGEHQERLADRLKKG